MINLYYIMRMLFGSDVKEIQLRILFDILNTCFVVSYDKETDMTTIGWTDEIINYLAYKYNYTREEMQTIIHDYTESYSNFIKENYHE